MQEYAISQVLHWFRRFDDYQRQKQQAQWQPLEDYRREDFSIGILGAGVLGSKPCGLGEVPGSLLEPK